MSPSDTVEFAAPRTARFASGDVDRQVRDHEALMKIARDFIPQNFGAIKAQLDMILSDQKKILAELSGIRARLEDLESGE